MRETQKMSVFTLNRNAIVSVNAEDYDIALRISCDAAEFSRNVSPELIGLFLNK